MERAVQIYAQQLTHNSAQFQFKFQNPNCTSCCSLSQTQGAAADRVVPVPTPASAAADMGTRRTEAGRERTRQDAPQERTWHGDERVMYRDLLRV